MVLKLNSFILAIFILTLQAKAQDFIQGPFQNFGIGSPVIGDFDGDEKEDVLGIKFFFSSDNKVVLQVNNSDSDTIFFIEKELNIILDAVGQPAALDIDNDSDLDIVVARNNDLQLFLLTNDGAANFTLDPLNISGVDLFQTADFDNDGNTDILGSNSQTGDLNLYINDGNQSFSTIPILINSSLDLEDFDIGDIDLDNDLDIVVGFDGFNGDQIVIYENIGSNNFAETVVVNGTFDSLDALKIHDLNNDGENDIVAIKTFSCDIFINQGNLSFEQQPLINATNLRSIEIGDYNGDGRSDIVLGTNDQGVTWHENLSNTPLTFDTEVISGISPAFTVTNINLNDDEATDLLALNGDFWWLENNIDQMTVSTNNLLEEEIRIFPNPFVDIIQFHNLADQYDTLEVYDRSGRIVYFSKIHSDQIDLSALISGIYFIRIKDSNGQISNSITVEKK